MGKTVKFLGHPVHQQLIAFPVGLLLTAAIFDIIFAITNDSRWTETAFYLIGAGVLGGLAAAVFGLLDWLGVPSETRAKRIGAIHGLANVLVVLLFIASFFLRWPNPAAVPSLGYIFSYVGAALILFTGWLGGELVDRLGIGVDTGAHVNAPSSLQEPAELPRQHRPAA
ncbi:MAG TPA: DUF2231 domain-containing protein [Bryobacteraceae bacterium]|nr:DUF2231 domain-containing protein [Bryobacteraceae bacterium]